MTYIVTLVQLLLRSPLPDLMSEDMMRDRERQKWEEEALEELSEETGPLHYQDVQHNGLYMCVLWILCSTVADVLIFIMHSMHSSNW